MLSRDEILAIYAAAGPEAVVQLVEALLATQAELRHQIATLTRRVAELEARLNKDSHNSHKPPSCRVRGLGRSRRAHTVCASGVARKAADKPAILGSPWRWSTSQRTAKCEHRPCVIRVARRWPKRRWWRVSGVKSSICPGPRWRLWSIRCCTKRVRSARP